MRFAAIIRRARTRPLRFLLYKSANMARKRARAFMAGYGVNPYRVRLHIPSNGITASQLLTGRLAKFDKALIISPDEAQRIASAAPETAITAERSEERNNLVANNRVSFLGCDDIDLDRVEWNLDYKSGLSWPKAWHTRIDYMDLGRPSDVKIPWELNRLQFLDLLGRSYLYTGDESLPVRFAELLRRWDRENPVGWSVSWACSMDCCFRAISLIWARTFFGKSPSLDNAFWDNYLRILIEHGRFVYRNLEYSDIRGNHYSSNLLGLLYISLVLPWYRESRKWKRFALRRLNSEILHETYPDGVEHEGSIPYHRLVMEIFLHAALLCRKNGIDLSKAYWDRLERMFEFTAGYLKPNGHVPLFGDNDNGKVAMLGDQALNDHRYLMSVGAVLFNRPDMKASAGKWWEEAFWLTGEQGLNTWRKLDSLPAQVSAAFPHGGFWFLRNDDTYAAIDCGDVGLRGRGAHGHNDTLSVEISLEGEDIIVDRGCLTYTSSRADRISTLSARGHNSVIVNGDEPSDISSWDIPGVSYYPYKALDWDIGDNGGSFSGEHRGYHEKYGVVCTRTLHIRRRGEVIIEDTVNGAGTYNLMWRWLYAAHLKPMSVDSVSLVSSKTGRNFSLSWSGDELSGHLEDDVYYPYYGQSLPTRCLVISGKVQLPYKISFTLRTTSGNLE